MRCLSQPLNFNACKIYVETFLACNTNHGRQQQRKHLVARDAICIRRAGLMNSVLAHGGRPLLLSAAKRTHYGGLVRATAGLHGVGSWVNRAGAAAAKSTAAASAAACSLGADRCLLRQGRGVAVPRRGVGEIAGRRLLHNAAATEPEEVQYPIICIIQQYLI